MRKVRFFTQASVGWGRVVATALLWLAIAAVPARAGDLTFSQSDAEAQAQFVRHLRAANLAAKKGDRAGAQAALRRAAASGGYTLPSTLSNAACGHMAFSMPLWVPLVQAQIGDVEGARQTARTAPDRSTVLNTLHAIAQAQIAPLRYAYRFHEVVRYDPQTNQVERRISRYDHLAGLQLLSDRKEAWRTLRLGLPYALAEDRAEAARVRQYTSCEAFADGGLCRFLAAWQAGIGDVVGAQMTAAKNPRPDIRALILLDLAAKLRTADKAASVRVAREAERQARALTDPLMRATFLHGKAQVKRQYNDAAGAREALLQAASAAKAIPDARLRADLLGQISGYFTLRDMNGGSDVTTPQNRASYYALLLATRDATLQIRDAPRPEPATEQERLQQASQWMNHPSRAERLAFIGMTFFTGCQDSGEARRTFALARQIADAEPSLYWRRQYRRMIDGYDEHFGASNP